MTSSLISTLVFQRMMTRRTDGDGGREVIYMGVLLLLTSCVCGIASSLKYFYCNTVNV